MPMMGARRGGMPMAGNQQDCVPGPGAMPGIQMMQERQAMMEEHRQIMEGHLANIEALLVQLLEAQKK
jgi:hypothetical protein